MQNYDAVIVEGRIYSFLINNKRYAMANGYLTKTFKGYSKRKDGRKKPEYHYKLTKKAVEEFYKLFENGTPQRLKKYMKES